MRLKYHDLVYDSRLGWIDPEDILVSIGVTAQEHRIRPNEEPDHITYFIPGKLILAIPTSLSPDILDEIAADFRGRIEK